MALILLPEMSVAQDKKTFRTSFYEAEYFFLNEEYTEAAFLYTELLKSNPANFNLHFLLGATFLSLEGSKLKAIPLLEEAVTSISAGYREGSYRETNAPKVALFALARAYHINNQFDEAILYYEKYKTVMKISDVADIQYVDKQIASVKLAQEYIKDTLYLEYEIICDAFDSVRSNYRAVYAEKDSIMVFMTDKPFYSAIMMSRMKNGRWSQPVILNDQLKVDGKYKICSISQDGTELYLAINREFNWDLYVSQNNNGQWSAVMALDLTINSKYNETHASLTHDKRRMYFTSDRPGGMGGMDIYYSERDQKGIWGEPVNLGKPVNSIYSEETPFITSDGRNLYFSSMSHSTMGGFDIFYTSLLPTNIWSYPANLGYPISTCDEDLFFVPLGKGKQAFYTAESGLLPHRRLLALELDAVKDNYKFLFRGLVTTADKLELDPSTVISIFDTKCNINIARLVNNGTGEFNMEIPAGDYKFTIEAEGYESVSEFINILPQHSMRTIEMEKSLTPIRVSSGEYAISKSILFDFNSHHLSDPAKFEVEKLYRLMSENPLLYVEVTGYTDAIGSAEYNLHLAQKRSSEVVSYLIKKGLSRENFISKAAGKTGFIALNVKADGSDNPEGRRFNRRVEINLVNTGNHTIVMEEILVPEHLKPQALKQLYVILSESVIEQNKVPSSLTGKEIKLYTSGGKYIYAAGKFKTRYDATRFLSDIPENDFPESRIISEVEFNLLLKPSVPDLTEAEGPFTVQVLAMRFPVKKDFFSSSYKITRIEGQDKIYRYISGIYDDYARAQKQLDDFRKAGFNDAFIAQRSKYDFKGIENQSSVTYYTVQLFALKQPYEPRLIKDIENINLSRGKDGIYRYSTGMYINSVDAEKQLVEMKNKGFSDAFIKRVGDW